MKTPSISLIIPVFDYPARNNVFRKCLRAIKSQGLIQGDEIIVVGDIRKGPLPDVESIVREFGPPFTYVECPSTRPSWGHDQANYGISLARGDYILMADDDDTYTPGAFDAIRRAVEELSEPLPILFRYYNDNLWPNVLWDRKQVVEGRIGWTIFATPNVKEKLGVATTRYEGDFDFIASTLEKYPPNSVQWNEFIIGVAGHFGREVKSPKGMLLL